MMRQRRHDLRLDVLRGAEPACALELTVQVAPEFHVARGLALSNDGFGKLAVQPGMHRGREDAILVLAEWNFAFHDGTHFLVLGLARTRLWRLVMSVAIVATRAGSQIVKHLCVLLLE